MSEEQKVSRSRDHSPTTCAAERTATESSAAGEAETSGQTLKACPFCGAAGKEVALQRLLPLSGRVCAPEWNIVCYVCHVETAHQDTRSAAIEAWNRRVQHGDLAGAVWRLLEDQEMTPTNDDFGEPCYLVPVALYEKVASAHRSASSARDLIDAPVHPVQTRAAKTVGPQ